MKAETSFFHHKQALANRGEPYMTLRKYLKRLMRKILVRAMMLFWYLHKPLRLVENGFTHLKHFREVASGCDKHNLNF